jgi:hypothetical protein
MECESAGSESTVEAKPRSESTVECEGAGSESTVEAKPRSESTMECESAGSESTVEAKAAPAKAAPAEADCGKAITARVRDTEGARAGKGRRSQRRTGCRNHPGGQSSHYLAHHDAHSFVRRDAPQPLNVKFGSSH